MARSEPRPTLGASEGPPLGGLGDEPEGTRPAQPLGGIGDQPPTDPREAPGLDVTEEPGPLGEGKGGFTTEYYFNPVLSVYGRYEHTAFISTDAASDFDEDEVRLGVKLRR